MKTSTKLAILTAIAAGAVSYTIAGYEAIKYATKRKDAHNKIKTRENIALDKENVSFLDQVHFIDMEITAFDDLKLKGKFLRNKNNSNKVII